MYVNISHFLMTTARNSRIIWEDSAILSQQSLDLEPLVQKALEAFVI